MTSVATPVAQNTSNTANQSADSASAPNGTSSSQSGAVPAQQPARSYANATKTATSTSPAAAGTSNNNAKSNADAPVNGAGSIAQGGAQPAMNGAPNGASDHGRKPSMVISPTGSSGYTQNGGPVGQAGRPPISFGSMNPSDGAQPSGQQQPHGSGAPLLNPRVISPAHSPSPIPQPANSGGRPPSSLPQGNGLNFGSMGGDMSGQQMPMMHERRTSSQSYGDMGGAGMRQGFNPGAGRGRGGFQPQYMSSPGQTFRQLPQRNGPAMQPPYPQAGQASPYNGGGRNSPAPNRMQPNMQQQMPYQGFQQNPNQPYQQFHPNQGYDPYAGYYQPYQQHYGQFQQPPQSPRPQQYPSAYSGTPGNSQPPFMPPAMSRSSSHMSERPTSSVGPSETPGQSHPTIATTPAPQPTPQPASQFVRPVKKSSAIKITNEKGEAVVFGKPAASPSVAQQPTTPVIVSTPNAPTPPPRAPSGQHVRPESKLTAQETQNAFKEQVKKQMEEEKRKREAADTPRETSDEVAAPEPKVEEAVPEKVAEPVAETKTEPAAEEAKPEPEARKEVVKEAEAEVEKSASTAASDDKPAPAAETADAAPAEDEEAEKKRKQQEEDDALEREIAEMEAREKEEEEKERAYDAKKKAEKEAKAKRDAANLDEDLKRQEREAEEREAKRERERAAEHEGDDKDSGEEPDEDSKDLFAALKKPTLGPGASAPESGAETPVSEAATTETTTPAEPAAPSAPRTLSTTQKAKPAHLKLETAKRVEPAEPTPGMQALKSARFLQIKQSTAYPDGIKSPNPALNEAKKARAYDKDFLLQFQKVFKEKPTIDWDQKVKDTLGPGDEPGSARGGSINSARTPSNRQPSGRGAPGPSFGGAMGAFGAGPGGMAVNPAVRGTTSEQRFQASQAASRGGMGGPGAIGRVPSAIGMGGQPMNRTASLQSMGGMGGVAGPNSPRQPSTRGRGGGGSGTSKRGPNTRQNDEFANKMPLTAGKELKGLEKSTSGWTARSITAGPMANAPDPSGNMAPDMVQRKVKASLNKMTPEKFDKISDQILEIASQSKNESDGRTLRQVIQLTFEKACDEAHWAGMYAQFCQKMLMTMDTEIRDETIKDKNGNPVVGGALFRKYLLNRCQEEFETGWQANLPDKPEGETEEIKLLSDEYYVAAAAKRRGLGLIQFIGQLYTLGMLTIRIMHECVMRLLNFEGVPDEAAIENLTTLLRAVGRTMFESGDQGQTLLKTYFERIDEKIMSNQQLPSRPRFMILDLIDLRKAGWKGKADQKGPKTLSQVHEEAAAAQAKAEAERQRQQSRPGGGRPPGGRGDARNFSGNNMPPPIDYRSSNVSMQELRGLSSRGGSGRPTGGLGPGGNLGPGGALGARTNSRRGLGPQTSGNSTRTNTPPVDKDKKEEPVAQQNAFSALAALDANDGDNDASPPNARNRSRSPMPTTEAPSES
ncbi:hypothetical protein B0A48_03692 [Cryoendolithus antarcticus]|uniref:MIF4G domain-containing protein n=1 Tax=Cryoendolithus antarcticus TaxID=1507870 RepID=A0A1V8TG89_9PEZI|nr:hypothetical protein B0A48_03692 [Cryoendolithus antarcticus]